MILQLNENTHTHTLVASSNTISDIHVASPGGPQLIIRWQSSNKSVTITGNTKYQTVIPPYLFDAVCKLKLESVQLAEMWQIAHN